MTFKLGIVSSYDVLCGNATYSQAILDGLPSVVEAVKIEVPIKMQKFYDPATEEFILEQVADCDAVNIQMELGLYGATPKKGSELIKKIIKRSKCVSLTMHRVEGRPSNFTRKLYNQIKIMNLLGTFSEIVKLQVFRIYKEIISYASKNNATFIVHTHREKKRILDIKPDASVLVHPIVWPDDYCADPVVLEEVKNSYGYLFEESDRSTIGLFGFMSDYKNFLQVVRVALSENKYNILLVGGTHPQSSAYGQRINLYPQSSAYDKYINKKMHNQLSEVECISYIYMNLGYNKKSLLKYIQSPEDLALIHAIKSVDIVCLPYTEVGQSASGLASLAVQFGKRVLFSDTFCSGELFKFLNRKPLTFDTKSDLSLAKALERASHAEEHSVSFKEHDFKTNIDTYLKSLKIKLDTQ